MSLVPPCPNPEPAYIDLLVRPQRSLSRRGFVILMAIFGVISLALGLALTLIGAWPILGFYGLEVLAVYLAFRISYGRARKLSERITLRANGLQVRRRHPSGRTERWFFQPHWVRLIEEAGQRGLERLVLTSHGVSVGVGDFLSPVEREDLALSLRRGLQQLKSDCAPVPL